MYLQVYTGIPITYQLYPQLTGYVNTVAYDFESENNIKFSTEVFVSEAYAIEEEEEITEVMLPLRKAGISSAASYVSADFFSCKDNSTEVYFGQSITNPLILWEDSMTQNKTNMVKMFDAKDCRRRAIIQLYSQSDQLRLEPNIIIQ